jgi:hypothetical protein
VQDEGSQLVAAALVEAPVDGTDRRWLDLCAGPGGKAGLLGAIAAGRGAHVTAVEIAEHRAELVARATAGLPVTVVHTDGRGILSLWHTDDRVIAEIQDSGFVEDPLVGRHPPGPADGRGYGLYLTHRLCDLVRLQSTRDGGTTVRMTMYLDEGPR